MNELDKPLILTLLASIARKYNLSYVQLRQDAENILDISLTEVSPQAKEK